MRVARAAPDPEVWRDEARALLAAGVAPHEVLWQAPGETAALFAAPPSDRTGTVTSTARVPRRFVALADDAVLHRAPGAHASLYRVLWRLTHGEPHLLGDAVDPDVRAVVSRAQQVRRDIHDMHAFVRFRELADGRFCAWYAPAHHIVRRTSGFFAERFAVMAWAILTPDESVAWDGAALQFGPGVPRHAAPTVDDPLEDVWRTYYAAIFNPARANPRVLRQHLPTHRWSSLPEASLIPDLLARAAPRVGGMLGGGEHVPRSRELPVLRAAAATCTACELCGPATQTVFGEGPVGAALVLVGEQPGDREDLAGRPFVGPAGAVLDAALADAGIPRGEVYLTNAVKHFRFLPRGERRIHQRPTADQIRACRPWVAAELAAIAPRVVVCLGATAAQSLIGSRFQISKQRGVDVATAWAPHLIATHHPAAILRVDPAHRPRYEAELRADLRRSAQLARESLEQVVVGGDPLDLGGRDGAGLEQAGEGALERDHPGVAPGLDRGR